MATSASGGGSTAKGKSAKRSLTHAAQGDDATRTSKLKNASLLEETPQFKKRKVSAQNNGQSKEKPDVEVKIKQEKTDVLMSLNWTTEDLATLIHNLGSQLPKTDKGKYSTALEKIDWSKINFGDHNAEVCKQKWGQVMTKVRRFRTLTELVEDAKEWVKHPWMTFGSSKNKNKHPDLPKKPLTPYFRFFLEKREKCSSEHPEMSMTELAKLLAKRYAELPEKKKLRYKTSYGRDNEQYKIQMVKFKSDHPDMFPDDHRSGGRNTNKQNGGPPKPQTPIQIFIAEKMTKHTNLDPAEKKEYEEKYRDQWRSFSTMKRVKWIKKAVISHEQYEADLAQYCIENPDFKPEPLKTIITKTERQILDRSNGKPEKPPNSGYSLYSKIMLKEIKDIPSKEKMAEISKRWKELTEKEKSTYAKQVTTATEEYQKNYASYLENLPEDERKKLEDLKLRKKKGTSKVLQDKGTVNEDARAQGSAKPKKPMSALFFYQQEKMPSYRTKHPDKSEQEITRNLAKEFSELSDKKKEKYKKMAEEAKKNEATTPVRQEGRKSKLFNGEPKKPPQSGYLLFTTELIRKLVSVEPKQRMKEISRQWKALTQDEQEVYKKKAASLTKKYLKDFSKFIVSLSDEDRKLYELSKPKKGGGSSVLKPSPAKKAKVVVASNAVESSNEADSDKDDNDSSNESGSRSDESSDDESGKSESGSDSESSNSSDSENTRGSSGSSSDDSDSNGESGSDSESDSGSDK